MEDEAREDVKCLLEGINIFSILKDGESMLMESRSIKDKMRILK